MPTAKERADNIIRESEVAKIRILSTPGNKTRLLVNNDCNDHFFRNTVMQNSSCMDENYLVISGHIDTSLREKIIKGDYVDFAKLLPKEKPIPGQDEQRLEIVNRGGQTFFVPAERDVGITNFHRWEQAFRIYSNIYTCEYPDRAAELIQYNHVIFTASSTYQWNNVYTYDREFRTHLSYFLERSWAIILQQAWSMHLKDRISPGGFLYGRGGEGHMRHKKEACKHFNKGLCTAV